MKHGKRIGISLYSFGFVEISKNLKNWHKFLCTMVVKSGKMGYTKDVNFLGCSITLLF